MIMVFVKQRFNVKRRRGDRDGFSFHADDIKSAKKELGQNRAAAIAIAGSDSFVSATFYDRDAFLADPLHTKPLLVIDR